MLLLEIFTDVEMKDHDDDDKHSRYDPSADQTVMKKDDTRKTRLTLKQINRIRTMQELRSIERIKDEGQYEIQYAPAPAAPM